VTNEKSQRDAAVKPGEEIRDVQKGLEKHGEHYDTDGQRQATPKGDPNSDRLTGGGGPRKEP